MSGASFAGVALTAETIRRAHEWFADNARACIANARSGATRVNDLDAYVEWQESLIADHEAGLSGASFAFLQRAHFIQTGESVPLLAQ